MIVAAITSIPRGYLTRTGGGETHRSQAPYLPRLLQLGRPPLLQDGLHGADEFRSNILGKKLIIIIINNNVLVDCYVLFARAGG